MGASLLPDRIAAYAGSGFVTESEAMRAVRDETSRHPRARMQLSVDSAGLVAWLVRLIGARRTLELGTFTGYSTLAVAQALPPDGRVLACDVSDEWTSIARRHFAAAGVADKIELRLAPALDTLDALLAAGEAGAFDFALVDADKSNYDGYYERCLALVRRDGLVVFDNMLWSGRVAEPAPHDPDTAALHAVNQKARHDPRVDATLLTVGDGLLVLRKR